MKKMLMIASVASMIDQFNKNNILLLQQLGYEVHVAANFITGNTCSKKRIQEFQEELVEDGVIYHQIDFLRNLFFVRQNYIAYKQLIKLMKTNDYELIHCHSPIGGVCGRLAANRQKVKVIYTAHGFHFYKGAPLINWILYYTIEKWLSAITDILITINQEDYELAVSKFHAKRVVYLPGIGIKTSKYTDQDNYRVNLRKQLQIPEDAFVLLSVGELSKRKNHRVVIKALAKLSDQNLVYVICGLGEQEAELKRLAESYHVKVMFLGYRSDVNLMYSMADIFVFPSLQEGLPVALMEAMAAGLPVVCSDIRGNKDLIVDNEGGFLICAEDIVAFSDKILQMIQNSSLRIRMSTYNKAAINKYDEKVVQSIMKEIYESD